MCRVGTEGAGLRPLMGKARSYQFTAGSPRADARAHTPRPPRQRARPVRTFRPEAWGHSRPRAPPPGHPSMARASRTGPAPWRGGRGVGAAGMCMFRPRHTRAAAPGGRSQRKPHSHEDRTGRAPRRSPEAWSGGCVTRPLTARASPARRSRCLRGCTPPVPAAGTRRKVAQGWRPGIVLGEKAAKRLKRLVTLHSAGRHKRGWMSRTHPRRVAHPGGRRGPGGRQGAPFRPGATASRLATSPSRGRWPSAARSKGALAKETSAKRKTASPSCWHHTNRACAHAACGRLAFSPTALPLRPAACVAER